MISVVIPIRNAEKTVEVAVRSVLSQSVQDLELLCVFNGCTDNSIKVVNSIKDPRIKILESEPGIVPALNEGLRFAKGDLIARQDADDLWLPDKLQIQLNFLKKNIEIDILGCQMKVVDENHKHIRNTDYPLDHDEIVRNLLNSTNVIGHPSVVFKKKILNKCAGYFDLFPLAEDMDLWVRCIPWYRFSNLPEVLVNYCHIPNPKYDSRVPNTVSAWYKMIYGVK